MHIQVKLFATLRRYLPSGTQGSACDMQVPSGTRVTDVLSQLGVPVDSPEFMVILINGRHAELDRVLAEGDVISAFPAMAGGT